MENIKIRIALVGIFSAFVQFVALGQRAVAITIDDPNTAGTPLLSWQERDDSILRTLDKHGIKAALFVCGMRVDDAAGQTLLGKWDRRNHLICNHSYSHFYYNSKAKTGKIFISDFYKGDKIIRDCTNYTRLFRFPYLKEGNSAVKRDSMRTAMAASGYRNGHVTIDASDWYIDEQVALALEKNKNADLTPYKEYYIEHILDRAAFYDSLARAVFKRDIRHTLLLHHSLLNSLFLDDLLTAFKAKGWKLIDAERAYKDNVFSETPLIAPCGESIIWQCAKEIEDIAPSLRYPAEDGEYEKEGLERYVQEYQARYGKG